jgi:hypothetical protein
MHEAEFTRSIARAMHGGAARNAAGVKRNRLPPSTLNPPDTRLRPVAACIVAVTTSYSDSFTYCNHPRYLHALASRTWSPSSMALTFSRAAPLKPEIRLAQAVSQFEASLSDGQKIAFRNHRSQTLKSPPSTKDVMRITAEIDTSQKAGGRCFGPRFTKFLHGAQQFAALGDVVVGSTQNVVACGVWSVLRICLLVRFFMVVCWISLLVTVKLRGKICRSHIALPRSI